MSIGDSDGEHGVITYHLAMATVIVTQLFTIISCCSPTLMLLLQMQFWCSVINQKSINKKETGSYLV